MSWMFTLLLVVQILASLAIISLVLLQQGKGADMGSSFGSGSAGSLFGATGAANFMSRATKWAAVVFFISTIGLAYVGNRGATGQDGQGQQGRQQRSHSVEQAELIEQSRSHGHALSSPDCGALVEDFGASAGLSLTDFSSSASLCASGAR